MHACTFTTRTQTRTKKLVHTFHLLTGSGSHFFGRCGGRTARADIHTTRRTICNAISAHARGQIVQLCATETTTTTDETHAPCCTFAANFTRCVELRAANKMCTRANGRQAWPPGGERTGVYDVTMSTMMSRRRR